MHAFSRRTFHQSTLGSLAAYSLLETLYQQDAFADSVRPVIEQWVTKLNQLGNDVKNRKIEQIAWQDQVEELFSKVDLPELLQLINFDQLRKNTNHVDRGARSLRFRFPEVEGIPKKLVFGRQIFALKKDRSVVPHGHNNMTTAFLMLRGECRGRHYHRLEDQASHIVIKPTIDRRFETGGFSSISDKKDNVHWFQATSETAFIFNIHVLNVQPNNKLPTGRVYLDPNGEKLSGGLIRAKRISHQEAHKLYG